MASPQALHRRYSWRIALRIGLVGGCCVMLAALAFYAGSFAYYFASFSAASRDEVGRVTSPSGRMDAVLYETGGDATVDFGYEVWVVRRGGSVSRSQSKRGPIPAMLYSASRNARAYGANLRWEGDGVLAVEYLEAGFVNHDAPVVQVGDDTVRIVLRAGVEDPSASGGGMLYNREGGSRDVR